MAKKAAKKQPKTRAKPKRHAWRCSNAWRGSIIVLTTTPSLSAAAAAFGEKSKDENGNLFGSVSFEYMGEVEVPA